MSTHDQYRKRRILTPAERQALNRQIQDHESDMRAEGANFYVPDRINSPEERATINRARRTMAEGEADSISQTERTRIEGREKDLREYLTKQMLSKAEMALRPGIDPRFRRAVNEHSRVEMSKPFQDAVTEWKNIRRQIDPNDPNAGNLETIRPDTR